MWNTQKAILPLFFVILSFSTWSTTFARENQDTVEKISENVYDFIDGKEYLRDKREVAKQIHTVETIDPVLRISKEVTKDESAAHKRRDVEKQIFDGSQRRGEQEVDLSTDIVRPIGSSNEELTLQEERIAILRHLADLVSKVSELADRANLTKEDLGDSVPSSIPTTIIENGHQVQNVYEDNEPMHDRGKDGERNRLPKRHLISLDGSSLLTSAASAASAVASEAVSSAASSSSSGSFILPTPLPLDVLEAVTCAVESVEHGHTHVLGIIVHEVLCEARKLWHFLLHALHNLKSEISLGPQINLAEAYAGASSFSGFLERSPVILEELLKEPSRLLALPAIVKGAVPLESIFTTLHRLKQGLHKLMGIVNNAIHEKLHMRLHNRISDLKELGLLEKLAPLEGISTVSSAIASTSTSASSATSETLINYLQNAPLGGDLNTAQEVLHAAKAVYDAYHASGFNEVFGRGSSSSSSASSASSSGPLSTSSSSSSSASATSYDTQGSYPTPVLPVIPLSSDTTTTSTITETVPSVTLQSPATVSTSSSATSTSVASGPEILFDRPTVVGTPLSSTTVTSSSSSSSGAFPNLGNSDVTSSSSSVSSSGNLLSQPQSFEPIRPLISSITPLVTPISSGSSSSSSSTASVGQSSPLSVISPLEAIDTVVSTSTSSASAIAPEIIGLPRIRPLLSELSSKIKTHGSGSGASGLGHNKQHRPHKHGHHKDVTDYDVPSLVSSSSSSTVSSTASSLGANLLSGPTSLLSPLSNIVSSSSSSSASSNGGAAFPLNSINSGSTSSSAASSASTSPVLSGGQNLIRPVFPTAFPSVEPTQVSSTSSSSASSSSNNSPLSPLTSYDSTTSSSSSSSSASGSPGLLTLPGRPILSNVVPFVESTLASTSASSSAGSGPNDVPLSPVARLRNFGKSFIPNIPLTNIGSSSSSSSSSSSGSSSPVTLVGERPLFRPILSNVLSSVEPTQVSTSSSSSAASSSNSSPLSPLANYDSTTSSSSSSSSASGSPGSLILPGRPILSNVVPFVESTLASTSASSSAGSGSNDIPLSPVARFRNFGNSFVPNIPLTNIGSSGSSSSASSSGSSSPVTLAGQRPLFRPILSNVLSSVEPTQVSTSSSSSAASSSNNSPLSPLTSYDSTTSSSSSSSSASGSPGSLTLPGRPILSNVVPFVESTLASTTASSSAGSGPNGVPLSPVARLRNFGKSFIPNIPLTNIGSSSSSSSSSSSGSSGPVTLAGQRPLFRPILSNVLSSVEPTQVSTSSSSSAASSSNNSPLSPLANYDSTTSSSSSSSSASGSPGSLILPGRPILSNVVPFVESTLASTSASSSAGSGSNDIPLSPVARLRNFGNSFVPNIPLTNIGSSGSSSSSSSSGSSSPVTLTGQRPLFRPVPSTVIPYVDSPQTSSASSSSASSSSNGVPTYPLSNSNSASSSSSSSGSGSPSPVILAEERPVLGPAFPTVVPFVESSQVTSVASSSTASSSSGPLSSSAASSAAASAIASNGSRRLRLPVVLPREKIIAAIGNGNSLTSGDVIVINLKSRKSLYARIADNDGPVTFSLLRPRIASSVFQTAGTVWNLSPRDFNDVSCENLFEGIY